MLYWIVSMIPKIIHYCWFGKNKKSPLIESCIASWKKFCPDYTIIEWNEESFDVASHPFTRSMYEKRRFAFVADYVRLVALEHHGGVYLDTDMLLVQPLTPLLNTQLLLGKESEKYISCGMIGAVAHHPFIEAMKKEYDTLQEPVANPVIMTALYEKMRPTECTVMSPEAFYPFDAHHIKDYRGQDLGSQVYGVHLWNYSWGHPLNKFFKKIGVYRIGKKIVEILGIKKIMKRLLGFV